MASSYANRFSLPAPSFSKPASLEVARGKNESKDVGTVLRAALSIGGFYSEESVLQRAADRLYHSIVCQTEDSDVLDTFSVEQNFQGLFGLIVLHVWMLLSRLRSEGAAGKELSQAIYHVFLDDVERRLHSDGLRVKVQNMLRELEQSFFGSVLAYDGALRGTRGNLATAFHRNVFQERRDVERSKLLERYVRRELDCLSLTKSAAIFEGRIQFSDVRIFQKLSASC